MTTDTPNTESAIAYPGRLFARIAAAIVELGDFIADKRNNDQGYNYLSADQILSRGAAALAKHGVIIFPSIGNIETRVTTTQNNKTRFDTRVTISFSVLSEDGARDSIWYGNGFDYSTEDKAINKAITNGHKYFMMSLLGIRPGPDDSESGEDGQAQQRRPARPQAQPRPTAQPMGNGGHASTPAAPARPALTRDQAIAECAKVGIDLRAHFKTIHKQIYDPKTDSAMVWDLIAANTPADPPTPDHGPQADDGAPAGPDAEAQAEGE